MNQETQNQIAVQLTEINKTYGQDLPYQRDRIVNETKFFMAQSASSMLEAGRRLVVLKENEVHGEFINILESDLKVNKRTAQVMMQASIKFLNLGEQKAQTFSLLGTSKLFELMTEDDEELEALTEGGTVAGLTLDEIDKMSVRELKKALREAREDSDAKDRTLSDKNKKIDDLSVKLEKKTKKLTLNDDTEKQEKLLSFQATWGEVSGGLLSKIFHARQIVEQATTPEEELPFTFQQKMTIDISEARDQLLELLDLLPDSAEPIDASWLVQEAGTKEVE